MQKSIRRCQRLYSRYLFSGMGGTVILGVGVQFRQLFFFVMDNHFTCFLICSCDDMFNHCAESNKKNKTDQ